LSSQTEKKPEPELQTAKRQNRQKTFITSHYCRTDCVNLMQNNKTQHLGGKGHIPLYIVWKTRKRHNSPVTLAKPSPIGSRSNLI